MRTGRIRILVADDHEVVRRGVRSILEAVPGFEVCGEAATGPEAVRLATRLKPKVVVLDISMPQLNALEATPRILQAVPGAEVIILTVHESAQLVREILAVGARGYVLKSDAGHELVGAVRSVQQHKSFISPRVSQLALQSWIESRKSPAKSNSLTPREREVLRLVATGKSNKEVSTSLGISVTTVETHRTNLMRKLGLHSVAELVRYAVRHQLVEA